MVTLGLDTNGDFQKSILSSRAGVYTDEGISGTKLRKKDCGQYKIDLILTKSISRFARN